jgi:hypothetical protein
MADLIAVIHQPLVMATLTGLGGAVLVDVIAFRNARTPGDLAGWSLKIALFKWAQGAVGGFVAGLGLGAIPQ